VSRGLERIKRYTKGQRVSPSVRPEAPPDKTDRRLIRPLPGRRRVRLPGRLYFHHGANAVQCGTACLWTGARALRWVIADDRPDLAAIDDAARGMFSTTLLNTVIDTGAVPERQLRNLLMSR
jgi:hypothetical protein